MNMQDYEETLIEELKKLLTEYEKRIKDNNGVEHNHISSESVKGMVSTGITVGGTLGFAIPIPGIGNAIGGAAGVALALGIAGIIEAHYCRKNKKIDNAAEVVGFFGDNKNKKNYLIENAAHKVIKDRWEMISKIHNPEKAKKSIVEYLAVNMIAAIKHNPDASHKIKAISRGLRETRSAKISDHAVEDNNSLRLKDIAKLKR